MDVLITSINDCIGLFYPKYCAACKTSLFSNETSICLLCLHKFNKTNFSNDPNNSVEKKFWGITKVNAATSYAYFVKQGLLQSAIYELKYLMNTQVGVELGWELAKALKSSARFQNLDLILPVPLHKRKKRKRGYNQCDHIAQGVSVVLEIPWSSKYLFRRMYTFSQTGKNKFNRHSGTKDIFAVKGKEELTNKHVLLIDDVITTGATLMACVDALSGIDGINISVATIAYA